MKKFIFLLFISTVSFSSFAQDSASANKGTKADKKAEKRQRINAIIKQEEEGNLSFRKQTAFGIQLRTNGYGGFIEVGKRTSPRLTTSYSFEFTETKHPKEEKSDRVENFFSNSFVYGKINNFYQAKLGFGQQYILGQKGNKNGVAVIGIAQGGLSMAFLKPYYLNVQDVNGQDRTISYYQDSSSFIHPLDIYGSAGIGKGWNEVRVKPGVFLKTALRFDFGRYNEKIQALEIGMSAEWFTQGIQILAYNDPKQLFFQGHVAFVFGSRK
ncbi:MAG: hypothetical protein ACJ749_09945 [Flavisolibacter sp.]